MLRRCFLSEPVPTAKLSPLRVWLIAWVSLGTFFLSLLYPIGDIGNWLHLDKFDYWYYNGLAPGCQAFICTLMGSLTARGHYLGGWIAAGAIFAVFGGLDVLFWNVDPTDRPLQSLEFMIVGVALGIIVLHVWRLQKKRKMN
jgi:hypothetical protein